MSRKDRAIDVSDFGAPANIAIGTYFADRRALHAAGLHRGLMRGIAPGGTSIVLSGGYEDDEDHGDVIIYTGEGGRDGGSRRQVLDQTLTRGNLALAQNCIAGRPVRVHRGPGHGGDDRPGMRYRYDGLYRVASYWCEQGRSGFVVWRFRLEREVLINTDELAPRVATSNLIDLESGDSSLPVRRSSSTLRIVRDTAVASAIKTLHEHACQACSAVLETPAGRYSESCHVRPLGRPHDGPAVPSNILCLCPNCHVLLDMGGIWIDDDLVVHPHRTPLRRHVAHAISLKHIRYHRRLFKPS